MLATTVQRRVALIFTFFHIVNDWKIMDNGMRSLNMRTEWATTLPWSVTWKVYVN